MQTLSLIDILDKGLKLNLKVWAIIQKERNIKRGLGTE